MIVALFKKNIWSSMKIMLIFLAIIAMYNGIVIYMYDPALSDMFKSFQETMPQMMSAAGMMGAQDTLLQFIHTYLYGMVMAILPIVYSIILCNKLIVRYVDSGSLACILATPNSRKKVIITQMFSAILSMMIFLVLSTLSGIIFSQMFFAGELDIKTYVILNVALLVFHLMILSITFISACIFTDPKYFYIVGAGLPILFFLIARLKDMGEKLENLKYLTVFTMFPDEQIISGEGTWLSSVFLMLGLAVILYGVGTYIFSKKDLPL